MTSTPLPNPSSAPLTCLTLFLIWCAANALCASDAHKLLYKSEYRHLFVDLTLIQTVFGVLVSAPLLPKPRQKLLQLVSVPPSPKDFYTAACHFLGCLLSNASFGLIGATSTLVWKLCEPFATVVFKWRLLHETVSSLRMGGVFIVVAGVFTFSSFSITQPIAFSPIVIANIAFPLRNVLIKADFKRRLNIDELSPQQIYFSMQATALPMCAFAMLMKSFLFPTPLHLIPLMLRNAVYFNVYQLASFALLSKLDALTHALANTLKRFSGIFLSALIIGTHLTSRHAAGLVLTSIGFPIYVLGDRKLDMRQFVLRRFSKMLRVMMVIVAFLTTFIAGFSARDLITNSEESFIAVHTSSSQRSGLTTSHGVQRDDGNLTSVPKLGGKVIIRIDGGYYPRNFNYSKYDGAVVDDGDNMGNLIWQYAGYEIIPDFSGSMVCHGSHAQCAADYPQVCNTTVRECEAGMAAEERTTLVLYRPTANVFWDNVNTFGTEVVQMNKYGDWSLSVGIGTQATFGLNGTLGDFSPGEKIETVAEDHVFTKNALRFLDLHERRGMPMLMRGDYTWKAAKARGYNYGISLGCPSLMLHEDVNIGKVLEGKYEALKGRIGDRSLKIAINIKTSQVKYFRFFKSILDAYPNSLIYAQGAYDMQALQENGVPFKRVRFFLNVPDWKRSIAEMDLSFGARIHGNMIAIAAGVPVFVIAPDHRVLELVDRMLVPYTTSVDGSLRDGMDVAELVSRYKFDGRAFDDNRCRTARVYENVYGRYGIGVSEQVKRIARSCS